MIKNLKIFPIALLVTCILTGCKTKPSKILEKVPTEKALTTSTVGDNYFEDEGILEYKFISRIEKLEEKLAILQEIYNIWQIDIDQYETISEADWDPSNMSLDATKRVIEQATKSTFLQEKGKKEDIIQKRSQLKTLKEYIEKKLFVDPTDYYTGLDEAYIEDAGYEEVCDILSTAIKAEIASACDCEMDDIEIASESKNTYKITINGKKYILSKEKAPHTNEALNDLFFFIKELRAKKTPSNEMKIQGYRRALELTKGALVEGLTVQDNNLIAKNTDEHIAEVFNIYNEKGMTAFIGIRTNDITEMMVIDNLGTNNSQAFYQKAIRK